MVLLLFDSCVVELHRRTNLDSSSNYIIVLNITQHDDNEPTLQKQEAGQSLKLSTYLLLLLHDASK